MIGGRVLLAVEPKAVAELSRSRSITLISGTNGKSTTTALTVAALGQDVPVATNRDGANTSVAVAGVLGSTDAQRAVLEVDEDWLPWVVEQTCPRAVVLTNLSRDQLTRHHEVGAVAASWRRGLAGVPLVIANADDPAVVLVGACRRQSGLGGSSAANWTADSLVCPACAGRCVRSRPDWMCRSCGLHRPEPDWWLDGDVLRGPDRGAARARPARTVQRRNAALALVAAHVTDGMPLDEAARRLARCRSVAGRFELIRSAAMTYGSCWPRTRPAGSS